MIFSLQVPRLYHINMLFDTLNDILISKKGDQLDNIDNEKEYSGYLINRWLSMYSPNLAIIINETVNKYYNNFITKKEHYKFLCKIIPNSSRKKIEYFKKDKAENQIDDKIIGFLAKNMQLSKREIYQYVDMGIIDYKSISNKLKYYEQKS